MIKLIIIIILFFIINIKIFNINQEKFKNNKKVLFLMRNYNRPEYLKNTLSHLDNSDVDICFKKIIYDDASNDKEVLKILNNYKKKYDIIFNSKNYKQKSMVKFLDIIKKKYDNIEYDFICYLDNDAIVKKNFIKKNIEIFDQIKKEQKLSDNKILLTGFNTNNHKILKSFDNYHIKKSIGGIHMFFHKSLLKNIKKWWDYKEDWGIVEKIKKEGGLIFCTRPSVVEHIGSKGYNTKYRFDKSDDF